MPYLPIPDHGLIGDLHTAALVGNDGRLVWLPWPNFSAPSLFTAILDDERGGAWSLAPTDVTRSTQRYDGDTAILITAFETPTGRAELWDWMSPFDGEAPGHDLCRELRCVEGEIEVGGVFAPRPDYARSTPQLQAHADGLRFDAHGLTLQLASDPAWTIDGDRAALNTTLRAGESVRCVLSSGPELVSLHALAADLDAARSFWQAWIARCRYEGPWRDLVCRSAIVLKLLTYAPTGAIVAAPTTSLPEWIGGERNWDYRYTWLRDASFTLTALCSLGYHEEEGRFYDWLARIAEREDTPLQIMYGIEGEKELTERSLDHLEGYKQSQPVRIGNGAYDQRQLDIYGGVLDSALAYEHHQNVLSEAHWNALRDEIDYVCAHWDEPDQGIWEMRGPPQQHTFSKLMCWVTVDRGIHIAEHEGWEYDRDRWHSTRDAIRESIECNAWNADIGAFTMAYGSTALDASVLTIPIVGFLPPTDERVRSTVKAIERELSRGALVYRYRAEDGLEGDEGAFLLCSFWLVDALTLIGEIEDARGRFEELIGYASTHGLLSEEVDPATGTALGNYPQAFSHIGLVNSALYLSKALRERDQEGS
jgi:GH15 family glucan-1,4-alpha-glucosidase